jgi:cytoskeleton protein RodZ
MQAGLSIEEAADRLHLPKDTVEAIEAGRFEGLGASIYVRAHLRRYAQMLAVSEEEILAAYDASSGRLATQPDLRQIITGPAVRSGTRRFELEPRQAVVGAIVIVLLGLVWWAIHKRPAAVAVIAARVPAAVPAVPAAPTVPTVPTMPAAPAAPAATVPVAATSAMPAALSSASASAAGPIQLTLTFDADSWVEIYDADGSKLFLGMARAGSRHRVSGRVPLRLFIGSPPGVAIDMNGRPLAWNSARGAARFRRFELDASGQAVEVSRPQP